MMDSELKKHEVDEAKEKMCSICFREARVKIDGVFYCWNHGEIVLEGNDD